MHPSNQSASSFDLDVHVLRFRAEVTSPLRLPRAAGAALRGALFGALRAQFCVAGGGPECGRPDAAAGCPVCFLLAPVDAGNRRGQDVPRPYVLRPPVGGPATFAVGQHFEFELVTFGRALSAFPYALLGVQEMGERGLGAGRAGGFRLAEVWAEHPFAGRQERVYRAADRAVHTPALPVTAADVRAEAAALAARPGSSAPNQLRLTLQSPTRLVEGGHLMKPEQFRLRPLLARLLERLDALGQQYGGGALGVPFGDLLRQADGVRVTDSRLTWQELFRGSGRHRASLPMGGLIGSILLKGDVVPLLPYLVWATLVHVGKDASMGNGAVHLDVI